MRNSIVLSYFFLYLKYYKFSKIYVNIRVVFFFFPSCTSTSYFCSYSHSLIFMYVKVTTI